MDFFLKKNFTTFLVSGIVLNALGLFTPILTGDSVLYADVSKYMAEKNDWINLFAFGKEWLDKPHFPFWMSALSFKIFGINSFSYKFPGFLFWLLGVMYVYKMTKILYDAPTAKLSVLVYVIALHSVIANFDVRAEPYLTALILAATYHMYLAYKTDKIRQLVLAAVFSGAAIMTKGLFVLVSIAGGFVIYWIIKQNWKQFFNPKWYLLLALTILAIFPEIYSLYTQFDLHPEKEVFGRTGVSGLQFFFWDSQFGRFFNTGPIKGRGDISFFAHTTLWAFLPWTIIFILSMVKGFKQIRIPRERWILYAAAFLTFLLFSFSGFQLPHYIVILFPHFSIATAAYLYRLRNFRTVKILSVVQFVLFYIALLMACILTFVMNESYPWIIIIALVVISLLFYWHSRKKDAKEKIMWYSYSFAVILYGFMNLYFYPEIMKYQSGMQAAKDVNKINQPVTNVMDEYSTQYRFYSHHLPHTLSNPEDLLVMLKLESAVAYVKASTLDELKPLTPDMNILREYDDFHTTKLSLDFLNFRERQKVVGKRYLITLDKTIRLHDN